MCVVTRPYCAYPLPEVVVVNPAFDGESITLRIPMEFGGRVLNRDFIIPVPRLAGEAADAGAPSLVHVLPELNVATTAFEGGSLTLRVPTEVGGEEVNRDFVVHIPRLEAPVWGAVEVELAPAGEVTAADDDSPYAVEYGGGD